MTPEVGTATKPATNKAVVEHLLNAKGWDDYLPYLSKDLFVKVGANDPMHSPDEYHQFMGQIYSKLRFISHDIRGLWEVDNGNVVIAEMDVNYEVNEDGRPVTVPCVDVYRFQDGKIKEWRIYPDTSKLGIRI